MGETSPKIKNFIIQDKALSNAKGRPYYGYFLDPGMGKTRVWLLEMMQLHQDGEIDAALILAKNSGKTNWVIWDHMIENPDDVDQVTQHMASYPVIKGLWISGATGLDKKCWNDFERRINGDVRGKLIVLVVNYQALLSEGLMDFLLGFTKQFRTYIAADESTQIAEISAKRTKRAIKLGKSSKYRRIGTGTPVLKRPLKIFAQAKFLDDSALGYSNFYSFRNRYARMGGFENRQVIAYQNLDELSDKIASFSIRAQAEDYLDLPQRVWKPHRVDLTPEQMKAYKTMREEFYAEVDGTEITAPIVLAQMTRLQQIIGGYLPNDEGEPIEIIPPSRNPKVLETLDIIDDAPGQSMVWFRFRPELDAMARMLRDKKISFYEFHGGVTERDRVRIRKGFQRGERDVVLATTSTGGDSIDEFKVANTVTFFSNDFNTETRIQAERRNWRSGSEIHKMVWYHDLIVPNTVDVKIRNVLRNDTKLSAKVLREKWREWI